MLRHIWVETTAFESEDLREKTEEDLCFFMEALTFRNQHYLRQRPDTPRLYKSGVVWEKPRQAAGSVEAEILREALGSAARKKDISIVLDKIDDVLGGEHFCDIGVILELGKIDCFPMSQKIIARSKSTGMYELLSIGELRFVYDSYEALSYNFETRQQEFKSIIGWVDKGDKDVSRVRLSNGTDLIATDSHKFWTLDGNKQRPPFPDSFRLGERTMGEYVDNYLDFKKGKLTRNQYTVRSRILQAARVPALGVTRPTQAQTYLAGIYAAEGFRSGSLTGIAQHKGEVREKIEVALAGVGLEFSYDAGGRGATPGSGAQYRLLGGPRNEQIAMLRDLGANSFDKRFPNSYLSADRETVRQLLDAHADGDGWRPRSDYEYKKSNTKSVAIEHSTSSNMLAEQIRLAHLILGNPTYAHHQQNHQGEGNQPIWRISEYNEQASKVRNRVGVTEEYLPGLTYATIRNAERLGKMRVGCIEVEGNHNFFLADGTLAANCDGLACWRAAELRQAGIKARPMMTSRKRIGGGTTYHAIVRWPVFGDAISGNPYEETDEDPSLLLGMSQPDRAAERQEEIRKNVERCDYIRRSRQRGYVPGFDYQAALEGLFGAVAQAPSVLQSQPQGSREESELQRIINRSSR